MLCSSCDSGTGALFARSPSAINQSVCSIPTMGWNSPLRTQVRNSVRQSPASAAVARNRSTASSAEAYWPMLASESMDRQRGSVVLSVLSRMLRQPISGSRNRAMRTALRKDGIMCRHVQWDTKLGTGDGNEG